MPGPLVDDDHAPVSGGVERVPSHDTLKPWTEQYVDARCEEDNAEEQ